MRASFAISALRSAFLAPVDASSPPTADDGERPLPPRAPGAPSAVLPLLRSRRRGDARRAGSPACHPVGVVGASAQPVAVGLARERMRQAGVTHAVLCTWPPGAAAPAEPAAGAAARRAAERLRAHGHQATAVARVVRVELPEDDAAAATAARRLITAAGDVPVVVLLAGARGDALDGLLEELDRILLVVAPDASPALIELAAAGLARRRPVRVLRCRSAALDRSLARGGRARRRLGRRAAAALAGPPDPTGALSGDGGRGHAAAP